MLSPWLHLEAAVGLQPPSLLEDHQGYDVIPAETSPRIVLAVGGRAKSSFLGETSLSASFGPTVSISQHSGSTIIIHGDLHHGHPMLRRSAGPPPEQVSRHNLQTWLSPSSSKLKIARFGFDLYWQAIAPFSAAILLFLDDLGGATATLEVLVRWIRLGTNGPLPRIVVIYKSFTDSQVQRLLTNLSARLNIQPESASYQKIFQAIRLLPAYATSDVHECIEEGFGEQEQANLSFAGEHLPHQLRSAISNFCLGLPVNVIQAARQRNPVPKELSKRLSRFMAMAKSTDIDRVEVVASALDLNAHPPGMHCEFVIVSVSIDTGPR